MTEDIVHALASSLLDLNLPDACLPGVMQNLISLAEHARRLDDDA